MFRASVWPSLGALVCNLLHTCVIFSTWCPGWCLGERGSRPWALCGVCFSNNILHTVRTACFPAPQGTSQHIKCWKPYTVRYSLVLLKMGIMKLVITKRVFKVRSGLKLPPIGCTLRERACAGSYMCSLANVCHFIAGRSLFYFKKDWIKMWAAINNPASCEFRAVIRFLLARNNNPAEIHWQLCEVYRPNVMSDSKVRQWCRLFEEGRTNVHDEERSDRPSVSQTIW